MATTEQIVEKVLYKVEPFTSQAGKHIYRFEIESFFPEAMVALADRLMLLGQTDRISDTIALTLDSTGQATLPVTVLVASLQASGDGYIMPADPTENYNLPLSYDPSWETRYLVKAHPNLLYYAFTSASGVNKINVYKGDGLATPPNNKDINITAVVIPSDPSALDGKTVKELVDILVEMCYEKLGKDQIPTVAPANVAVKQVAEPGAA